MISQCTTAPIIRKTATTTHTEIIVIFSRKKDFQIIFFHYFAINIFLLKTETIHFVEELLQAHIIGNSIAVFYPHNMAVIIHVL